jgi:secreted trypsin-like serine protease
VEKAEDPYLRFRFDAPQDPGVTQLEGISGVGDSGGPAYIERGGVVYVIGVSSAQDARPAGKKEGHYGVLEYYPRVSFFAGWIQETIRAH